MILVDSSVWIDYFNGIIRRETDLLDEAIGKQQIIIGDIILLEVLQGFKSNKDYNSAKSMLGLLPCYTVCNPELAIIGAENFRKLRNKGITIRKTIDVIIATFCIYHEHTLLHCDRDFDPFQTYFGLKVLQ